MKLLMQCEHELPSDFFLAGKVAARLEPHWLKLMEEVRATLEEYNLRLITVRCEPVHPRPRNSGEKTNSKTPSQRQRRQNNIAVLPHAQLPVDETV